MNKSLSIIAVLLAGAALLTVLLKGGDARSPAPTEMNFSGTADLSARVDEMQRSLVKMEKSYQELLAKVNERAPAPVEPGPPALDQIEKRFGELEAKQTQLAQLTRDIDKYGVISAMETELVDAYQTLLDENQPLKARLSQVEKLKRYGHFDDRAVQSMMTLLDQTGSLDEKSGVLQALSGAVKTPEFRDRVLTDLSADIQAGNQSARFRYHAIEALEPMLPDPVVQEWLTHLAQNDPEYKLAVRAGQSVGITPPAPVKK